MDAETEQSKREVDFVSYLTRKCQAESGAKPESSMVSIRVDSVTKWIEVVMKMERSSRERKIKDGKEILGPRWLFRGQANATWNIKSSFEHEILEKLDPALEDVEQVLRIRELEAIKYFQRWAPIQDVCAPKTKGEWLALMQHYRVPTRLVDFSEVPLVSLAFALEDESEQDSHFAVWAVRRTTPATAYSGMIMAQRLGVASNGDISDTRCNEWLSDENDIEELERSIGFDGVANNSPARILKYIPHSQNNRMKRQRGLFLASTCLSVRFMPLLYKWIGAEGESVNLVDLCIDDVILNDGNFQNDVDAARLIKFVFDKNLRNDASDLVRICNIGKRTLYGDIQEVAQEAKKYLTMG